MWRDEGFNTESNDCILFSDVGIRVSVAFDVDSYSYSLFCVRVFSDCKLHSSVLAVGPGLMVVRANIFIAMPISLFGLHAYLCDCKEHVLYFLSNSTKLQYRKEYRRCSLVEKMP